MITCMVSEIITPPIKLPDFGTQIPFAVVLCRFACATTLHLKLVPSFVKGMKLIHFVNNNPELFLYDVSAYMVGLLQVTITLIVEFQNLYNLMSYTKVELVLVHFITLPVVLDLATMYVSAGTDSHIKAVFKHPVKRVNRGRDIKFSERSCFHKCGRVIYKLYRLLLVSYVFYLVPFTEILVSFFVGFPYNYNYGPREN
jgi:hypothetical protein